MSRKLHPVCFRRRSANTETKSTSTGQLKHEAFDQEQLTQAWHAFGERRRSQGANDVENLVMNRELILGEDGKVKITCSSQLEVSILEKFETDMIQFLRQELKNDYISLETAVMEQTEAQKLYTSKDIYEHMVKQNPDLKELKERLGLDFDF